MPQLLGLIAGAGGFPLEIARAARGRGDRVHAIGFHSLTRPGLESAVDELEWLHLGELDALLRSFDRAGVRDAVMAGKVEKAHLYGDLEALRPDARAMGLLANLRDRRDDSILGALADLLEDQGIALHPQTELVPELLVPEGVLGSVSPTASQWEDVAFAWPIAMRLAGVDIGQCVVVKDRAVLAVEAIEGTDATVRRAGALGGPGTTVLKVAKPQQDPRFDIPTIGLVTLEALIEVGGSLLAFEADATIVLDRSRLIQRADAHGVALLAIGADFRTKLRLEEGT